MSPRRPAPVPPVESLSAALARLYQRNLHTIKLGLDVERALCARLGDPQDAFLSLHVAGTNGKGSVCAMLAAVLEAAGFRTGLYTSPHLVRFNERIRVNGEAIPDVDLVRRMEQVEGAARAIVAEGHRDVTFFEFTTALAFAHFRERRVQIAVLETGMGGRLDATNVVTPVLSVITSIGLDHQAFLGDTVEKIAAEKAGIIKEGRPVICGAIAPEPMEVIRRVARERTSSLRLAAQSCAVRRTAQSLDGQRVILETGEESIGRVALPLLGEHQLANCALAMAALDVLREETGLAVPPEAVRKGLGAVRWPARCQVLERDPPVVLDGGHNAEAARALAATLDEVRGRRPLGLLVSFLADKDPLGFLREVAGPAERCWIVSIQNERAMPMATMMAAARTAGLNPEEGGSLAQALATARAWARERSGLLCVAGSLYLAGEALQVLGVDV